MCQHHSIHTYDIPANLTRWGMYAGGALLINWLAHDSVDDFRMTWLAGASCGFLAAWSLEIGREWLKVRLPRGCVA